MPLQFFLIMDTLNTLEISVLTELRVSVFCRVDLCSVKKTLAARNTLPAASTESPTSKCVGIDAIIRAIRG
jgi:hypothetical protein